MKKKQLIAAIVAVALFIVVCVSSMSMNLVDKWVTSKTSANAESLMGGYGISLPQSGKYVAVVSIDGQMTGESVSSYLGGTQGYDHSKTVEYLEALSAADNNVGVLLYVNSPGGYSYIGDDLYLELEEYKEETGRPIYAYFDMMAASAAYEAAMSSDEIYANRMTTTGAIGAYCTYYDMSELYEKLGVKEILIKSGENKGMGSYGQEMTAEQIAIEQSQVDEIFNIFVDTVVEGRGLERSAVLKLADGRSFSAQQALDNGLIDGICRYEEYQEQVLGYFSDKVTFYEPSNSVSPLASLFGAVKELVPKSENEVILELLESNESEGPKYESVYR